MRKLMMLAAVALVALTGTALAAKSRPDSGVFHASIQQQEGKDLYVAGNVKDKIYGRGAIVYVTRPIPGAKGSLIVNARTVTVFFPNGSISGTGKATQVITGATSGVLKNGSFKLTKGTGIFKGKTMAGTFSGTEKDSTFTVNYKDTIK